MARFRLMLALIALPCLATAQSGTAPGSVTTPGPTANPATSQPSNSGTAAITADTPQAARPPSPVPATPPSGVPPDVIVTPK